jgi:hypothetical protein
MMRRWRRLLLACAGLAALGGAALAFAAPHLDQFRLTFNGLGPLHVGMTRGQVQAAGYRVPLARGQDANACVQALVAGNRHIRLMFEAGRVTRVEVLGGPTSTWSGIRVGATEEQVRKTYGARLTVRPHKYDPQGHTMLVFSRDKQRALVLDTDGHVVKEFRAGLAASAQYVEGCS